MIDHTSTTNLFQELEKTSNIESFMSQHELQQNYLNYEKLVKVYFKGAHLKMSTFIDRAHFTRSYAYEVLNGQKIPSRDNVIKIGLALTLELNALQKLLLSAKHNPLHPKDKRDCVLIYCFHNHHTIVETNLLLYEFQQDQLN